MNALRKQDPVKFEAFLKQRYEFVYEMANRWQRDGISALLTPFWPHCACKASNAGDMGMMLDYSVMWNITGFPAGILPITRVRENEQTFNDSHGDFWTRLIHNDCEDSSGMPICLQIVGYAFEDEKVLGIMKKLEKQIKYEIEMPPIITYNK